MLLFFERPAGALASLLGACGDPMGIVGCPLGIVWGSLGFPGIVFACICGALCVSLWGSVGCALGYPSGFLASNWELLGELRPSWHSLWGPLAKSVGGLLVIFRGPLRDFWVLGGAFGRIGVVLSGTPWGSFGVLGVPLGQ